MTGCKIDILVERYGLDPPRSGYGDIHKYMIARWHGEDDRPAEGYGSLTKWFNKRLLRHKYEENGRDTIGVRLDSEFEALTEKTDVVREEVMDDLRRDGIDPKRVVDEFISRSTMRRHLNDCLDEKKNLTKRDSRWEQKSIDFAIDQADTRVREALQSLASKNEFPDLEGVEMEIEVYVKCDGDSFKVPLSQALMNGLSCLNEEEATSTAQ